MEILRSPPGPAPPRFGAPSPVRHRARQPRSPSRPGGVSSAGRGYRSPWNPAGARPGRAAGAERGGVARPAPRLGGAAPMLRWQARPRCPGPPFPPAARPRQSTARGAAPGRGALSAGAGLRPLARSARVPPRPAPGAGSGAGAVPVPARYLLARRGARRGLPARSMVLPAAERPRRGRAGGAAAGPPRAARALKRQRPRPGFPPPLPMSPAPTAPLPHPFTRRDGPGVPAPSRAGPGAPHSPQPRGHVPTASSSAPQSSP